MPKITLKAARVNAGFSQKEAAKKLGINKDTLSRYENGKVCPRQDVLAKMSEIYRIDLQYIFLK